MKSTKTKTTGGPNNMPRFKWNYQGNGRLLNKYIDYICDEFPALAKDIVKHGIGDLNDWLDGSYGSSVGTATCGCLVGTTCLMAVKRYEKTAKASVPGYAESHDPSRVLFELISARTGKNLTRNDDQFYDVYSTDPLYRLIKAAGEAASEEATPPESTEWSKLYDEDIDVEALRQKQVIDHFEGRIRKNLNIPYPKQVRKHATA